jgi:uncharacterized protein (TIGR04222 family)
VYPFNLPGPQFLLFYLCFGAIILAACWYMTRRPGANPPQSLADLTSDPYLIAYLRGGEKEAIRVAVFNLVDRGFLEYDGTFLRQAEHIDASALRRPFDRVVITQVGKRAEPAALLVSTAIRAEGDKYKADLVRRNLLPDADVHGGHLRLLATAVGVLAGVAIVKVVIALAAGHTNVAILIILAVVLSLVSIWTCVPRTTPTGSAAMRGLQTLLDRLAANASRLRAGGSTNEALLLAAVAGFAALPSDVFASARRMFPARAQTSSGGDSSSGSSCSSGSSGCGGGGGCGGCGG